MGLCVQTKIVDLDITQRRGDATRPATIGANGPKQGAGGRTLLCARKGHDTFSPRKSSTECISDTQRLTRCLLPAHKFLKRGVRAGQYIGHTPSPHTGDVNGTRASFLTRWQRWLLFRMIALTTTSTTCTTCATCATCRRVENQATLINKSGGAHGERVVLTRTTSGSTQASTTRTQQSLVRNGEPNNTPLADPSSS